MWKFTLTATASDDKSGIARYEFYVDGEKKEPTTIENGKATYTWTGTGMVENKECYVIVYDLAGNSTSKEVSARTQLHTWELWDVKVVGTYYEYELSDELTEISIYEDAWPSYCYAYSTINFKDSNLKYVDSENSVSATFRDGIDGPVWIYQAQPSYLLIGQAISFIKKETKKITQSGYAYNRITYYYEGYAATKVQRTKYGKRRY